MTICNFGNIAPIALPRNRTMAKGSRAGTNAMYGLWRRMPETREIKDKYFGVEAMVRISAPPMEWPMMNTGAVEDER